MLTEILLAGIIAIVILLIVVAFLLRVDNSRTERERIRSERYILKALQTGGYNPISSSGYGQDENGEMGWVSSLISDVVAKNPELVQTFLNNLQKKE